MASSKLITCGNCNFQIETWDDGNPYVQYPGTRKRHYYYHPAPDLQIDTELLEWQSRMADKIQDGEPIRGNAPDHICLDCGTKRKLDPDHDKIRCSRKACRSQRVVRTHELEQHTCPKCNQQDWKVDHHWGIS